eukprot:COSAG02_NODE_4604_length_5175_cov_13.327817_2_plen_33_part_00
MSDAEDADEVMMVLLLPWGVLGGYAERNQDRV